MSTSVVSLRKSAQNVSFSEIVNKQRPLGKITRNLGTGPDDGPHVISSSSKCSRRFNSPIGIRSRLKMPISFSLNKFLRKMSPSNGASRSLLVAMFVVLVADLLSGVWQFPTGTTARNPRIKKVNASPSRRHDGVCSNVCVFSF